MKKQIAVLEGDGIGPEIVAEGIKVLKVIEQKYKHEFILEYAPFGADAYFSTGHPFPEKTREVCDRADAIIKGPVGLAVEKMNTIPAQLRPEIAAVLPLRARYQTYLNYRPVRLPASLADFSPLKPEVIGEGIDILMIRELVGGIYFGRKVEGSETAMQYASDESRYTEQEVRHVALAAFREARQRGQQLTNVHKANVLASSRFWNAVVEEVAGDFRDVAYQSLLVDNVAFQLVTNPRRFNGVMLLENMQGDILTDQAGGIIGSLGLMPSACLGAAKGYVEAAHGSAPDIANQNIANPYSLIGSVAFLLDKCFGLVQEAEEVWTALFGIFQDGYLTRELAAGKAATRMVLSTSAFGDMVAARLAG